MYAVWSGMSGLLGALLVSAGIAAAAPCPAAQDRIAPSGGFRVQDGRLYSPSGSPFFARGINVYDKQVSEAEHILRTFPGLNFVRLNVYSYPAPTAFTAFIHLMTARHIVVAIEDHSGISKPAYTGAKLKEETDWYGRMAVAWKDNPYVWFGTFNEPSNENKAVTAQHAAIYDAIRGAGNNAPVLMELIGGGNPDQLGIGRGLVAVRYAAMRNIVWDLHQYNWPTGYSTDPRKIARVMDDAIRRVQEITGADGRVPIIIGEFGPATDGNHPDPGGDLLVEAVVNNTSTSGWAAWHWQSYAESDNLTDKEGQLTDFGRMIGAAITRAKQAACE